MNSRLLLDKAVFALMRAAAAHQLPFALAAVAALVLAATFAYQQGSREALKFAREDATGLGQRSQVTAAPAAGTGKVKLDLQAFRSSHLLAILEQGASTANIKLDEISFAIDDSPNQPYVRYRATFTVLSRYATIRRFISEILAGSEGVVLDTVACRREDINAADVRCDISAYVAYQEKAGG